MPFFFSFLKVNQRKLFLVQVVFEKTILRTTVFWFAIVVGRKNIANRAFQHVKEVGHLLFFCSLVRGDSLRVLLLFYLNIESEKSKQFHFCFFCFRTSCIRFRNICLSSVSNSEKVFSNFSSVQWGVAIANRSKVFFLFFGQNRNLYCF